MLSKLTLDNGNEDGNENTHGDENKTASENEDWNEVGAEMKVDIIEKNKATTRPAAISTDAGDALIPSAKSPENSMLAEVMTRREK